MNIIAVIVILAVIGFLMWLINTKVPMQSTIRTIMNFVVVLLIVLWLLSIFGLLSGFPSMRVGT